MRISKFVREYDRNLELRELSNGQYQVHKRDYKDDGSFLLSYLFSLTNNWKPDGENADWGLEPILDKLKSMDTWRDDSFVHNAAKVREKEDETRKQSRKNEFRAIAADCRKDFAKAFN